MPEEPNVLSLYIVIVTGIFFLFTIMYFQYFRLIRIPFPILWFVLLIGIYVISIFALPIPCVEDGEFHFINAYAISNMIMQRIPGLKSLSEEVPSGVLRMVTYSDAQYLTHFLFDWTYGNDVVARAGEFYLADSMPHYSFIIPAIDITLMRVLRAPYQMYLVAAQLMNVIMFAGVTLLAMRVCPTLQPVIVALSILPSVQWFVNSCSYDVWNLAFCILFVCLCKKMRDSEFVRITDIVLAMVTYILFAPIKTAYFNFALFIYFIEKKQLTQKKFKSTTFFLSIMLIGAEIVVFASRGGEIVAFMGESGFDARAGLTMDTTYTISWIVSHPIQTMKIFAYTFYVKGWQFPLTFFVNQRLIVAVPRIIRYAFPALFVFICMGTFEKKRISCKEKMLSGIVLITGIVIILTVFLLIYTEKSDTGLTIVAGLQGRYFIPYLLCLPFLVPQAAMATKHIRTAEYVLFLCSVISILSDFVV